MNKRTRRISIATALLLLLALTLYLCRYSIFGAYFLFLFGSAACCGAAFCCLLFLPWRRRWLQRLSKILKICLAAALVALLVSFIIVQGAISRSAAQAQQPPGGIEKILVLGTGLNGDQPSPVLQARLQTAERYLQQNPQSVAVLSGGQGDDEWISEALAMQRWLLARGIAAERLLLEEQSRSTAQNLAFSQGQLQQLGAGPTLIISSDFHLLRVALLADHYGYDYVLLAAPTPPLVLTKLACHLREYFAVVKEYLVVHWLANTLPESFYFTI